MMKKLFALLLAGVMMLSLVACGGTVTTVDNADADGDNISSDATVNETPKTTAAKEEDWVLKYYVDEFDQPTSDWYITNRQLITGKFSNSATTDSKLSVKVLIDDQDVCFVLYEYGSHQVKNSYSKNKYFDIKMKDVNGKEHTMQGGIVSGGDRVAFLSKDIPTVLNALKQEGTVMFYLVEDEYTTSTYLFSVETSNLGELLK